jgi:serine/threonine protein kinase
VVHRDLKPLNILVTDEGEPKLLDFGIAKILDLTADATMTGMQMLTPDYASPEQVTGNPVTTTTDIYSLGALLYKLLTGSSPHKFDGESVGAIALGISAGRITSPAKLAPALKGDLEMILLKALRTQP